MKLHEQVIELKAQKELAIEAIYDFSSLLSSDKFKNTDTEMNNWINISDVQSQLRIILDALQK